jgi:guanylate kinase
MRIAIAGTSGVGKTYLETILANKYKFVQLPKTTDRPKRPQEISGQGIFFKTRKEIESNFKQYFFSLEYAGHIYAWQNNDLLKSKNATVAITMEGLENLITKDLLFIPILLYIDQENLSFLEKRIKDQLNYKDLTPNERFEAEAKIIQRLNLAQKELININKYIEIVESVPNGKAFNIKDDNTIFNEVLPYIEKLLLTN